MGNEVIEKNSMKAWFLAARPKTLSGAIVPVAIALSLAWRDNAESLEWLPAALCLLFACMMQIDANLINDYYDCIKGIDGEDRLGPERACSQGWITTGAMKKGIGVVTVISALIGLPLMAWGVWEMLAIGAACIVFCFLYTTLLSGKAMGDILVLLFFGIIPVCTTYYIQTGRVTANAIMLAVGCGLATDILLIVNNFRDRITDKKHGKITLVTLIGEKATMVLAIGLIIIATVLALSVIFQYKDTYYIGKILLFLYAAFAANNMKEMWKIHEGKALNGILGKTALSILIYGIGIVMGVVFST